MTLRAPAIFLPVLFGIGLGACGGGGGGGDGSTGSVPAKITANNAVAIAGSSLRAAASLSGLSFILTASLDDSGGASTGLTGDRAYARLVRRQALARSGLSPLTAFDTGVIACDVSGTVRFSGNLASDMNFTTGDTVTAAYTNCDDGLGYAENGRLQVGFTAFSGDVVAGTYDFSANVDFTNYRLTLANGESFTWNGGAFLQGDTTTPGSVTARIVSDQVTLDTNSADYDLSGFLMDASFQIFPPPVQGELPIVTRQVSLDVGALSSSRFAGEVELQTEADLEGSLLAPFYAGSLVALGDNSGLRILPQDPPTSVDLALDLNGDGVEDDVLNVTPQQLNPPGT